MNKPLTKGDSLSIFSPQEAAEALNEQGFLFQQIVRDKIQNGIDGTEQQKWKILGHDYPVTATDGSQTRIDLVLCHFHSQNVHLCIECKRPNPRYKAWIFFNRDKPEIYIEEGRMEPGVLYDRGKPIDYKQMISSRFSAKSVPVFNFYLEAATKNNSDKRASHSETIEKALRQIIAGHTGMMEKLRIFEREAMSFYRSIPLIVTTAELFEAQFNCNDVSLQTGMIEPSSIKMEPLSFCAVNYHPDDSLSLAREHTIHRKGDVLTDMIFFQNRTVFIVNSSAINNFLFWAGQHLIEHPS